MEKIPAEVDFNFHIQPILADRCFKCHGPDEQTREADLRLDLEEEAFKKLAGSGGYAFARGSLSRSVAWKRIIAQDPEYQMPPPESNLHLTAEEKALLARWVEQGAEWKKHWSFIPPSQTALPDDFPTTWDTHTPIDHFLNAALHATGMTPNGKADPEHLIRRLYFDLTGLPPDLSDIDAFLADTSEEAYVRLVDRLLETDAHAERMTMEWLDVARYADSHGMHADGLREMWPWRDWVIRAFKKNLPYDDFVRWQVAGDLLPNATREQHLATGFYRNQPLNSELGIVSEEFRLQYVADRTTTTATAFLGLTLECASCHDHKFDPISQKEFYELSAFFNNVKELGMIGNDKNFGPVLLLPDSATENRLQKIEADIGRLEQSIALATDKIDSIGAFVDRWKNEKIKPPRADGHYPLDLIQARTESNGRKINRVDNNREVSVGGDPQVVPGKIGQAIHVDTDYEIISIGNIGNFNLDEPFSAGAWINIEKTGTFQAVLGNIGDKNTGWRGWLFFLDTINRPGFQMVHSISHNYLHVVGKNSVSQGSWAHVFFTYDGSARGEGVSIYLNGEQLDLQVEFDHLYKNILPVRGRSYTPDPDRRIRMGIAPKYLFSETDDAAFRGSFDDVQIFKQALTALEVRQLYEGKAGLVTEDINRELLLHHHLARAAPEITRLQDELQKLRSTRFALLDPVQDVMVMREMPTTRPTFVLDRGQYDAPAERVYAGTPKAIMDFPPDFPRDRLGLADWLLHPQNPLTARVTVNRYWQMLFGRGLVDTPHDFGTQGSLPSHPDLLDWLAIDFQASGWDLRRLLKMMVCSAAYMRASHHSEDHGDRDPDNIYLARGPSHRFTFEMIRDNALAASGLLNSQVGGKSVRPYQPPGLWKEKNEFSGFLLTYNQGSGSDLYRRSLYTFIRRTSPPPAMTTFNVPSRNVCAVQREKTNTPLQALILMNDPQFVEAARALADKVRRETKGELSSMCEHAFRLLCGRRPSAREMQLLVAQYEQAFARFQGDEAAARDLLAVGEHPSPRHAHIELAAMTTVVSTIMNFEESYVKR